MKTYRFRLYPSKAQARLIEETRETCRRFYNDCLAESKEVFEREGSERWSQPRDAGLIGRALRERTVVLSSDVRQESTYLGSRGVDLFRSRDVNAPPPPLYLARPDPTLGQVRQIEFHDLNIRVFV